jgi:HKD family nuclease
MGRRLQEDLRQAQQVSVASAFAKPSAFDVVNLPGWCGGERRLRMLVGTDFALTDLAVVKRLQALPGADCRVFHTVGTRGRPRTFHPKLYIVDRPGERVVYVGSSNFTAGGLRDNIEANVRLAGRPEERELKQAEQMFLELFDGELSTPLSADLESSYEELRRARQEALAGDGYANPSQKKFHLAAQLLLGAYRGRVAGRRWLLVTTPANYDVCMKTQTWGRQNESDARAYQPGEVFFFHVTEGRGILAMGMFTGEPYRDDRLLWQAMDGKGHFPWRIRFVPLGELRLGLPTRKLLEPRREGAPKNWFHGFIQASHTLTLDDFSALRAPFEASLRAQVAEVLDS